MIAAPGRGELPVRTTRISSAVRAELVRKYDLDRTCGGDRKPPGTDRWLVQQGQAVGWAIITEERLWVGCFYYVWVSGDAAPPPELADATWEPCPAGKAD